jgi:hypothetical protein
MKDLIIPAKLIRREINWLAFGIVLAFLVNVGAILAFKTQWNELLITWPITLALAGIVYALLILPRLCWAGLCRLLRRPDRPPLSSKTRLQSTQNAK